MPTNTCSVCMPIGRVYFRVRGVQCRELMCDEEDIGETSRTLGERYKEHLKEPSPSHVHSTQTGHNTTPDNFQHHREGGPCPSQDSKGVYLY